MKGKPGSSTHFVITAVSFNDTASATACDEAIGRLRRQSFRNDRAEFHFNTCSHRNREIFLRAMAAHDFRHWSLVVNKKLLAGQGLSDRSAFYDYASKLLLEMRGALLKDAVVCLDRSGNRDFYKHLQKVLRGSFNAAGSSLIQRLKTEHSHSNNLLQLADMVCGAVARSFYGNKEYSQVYRKMVQTREEAVRVWPAP